MHLNVACLVFNLIMFSGSFFIDSLLDFSRAWLFKESRNVSITLFELQVTFKHVFRSRLGMYLRTDATKKKRVPEVLKLVRNIRHLMKFSLAHYIAK